MFRSSDFTLRFPSACSRSVTQKGPVIARQIAFSKIVSGVQQHTVANQKNTFDYYAQLLLAGT